MCLQVSLPLEFYFVVMCVMMASLGFKYPLAKADEIVTAVIRAINAHNKLDFNI